MFQKLLSKKIIFVGGKGGVGKTTNAAALAYYFANCGQKTLVISTDPAHSLGDVLSVSLSNTITAIYQNLDALELDEQQITKAHFEKVEATIKSYAKPEMMTKLKQHLDLAREAPGAQEAAILEKICFYINQFEEMGYEKLIFDTAPTGHTLRLLILPEIMTAWTEGLLTQQRKQNKLKDAAKSLWQDDKSPMNPFTDDKTEPWQKATVALEERKELFKKAREILHAKENTAIILVMVAEKLPLLETARTIETLSSHHFNCSTIIINQIIPKGQENKFWQRRYQLQQSIIDDIKIKFTKIDKVWIDLQSNHITGEKDLTHFFDDAVQS